MLELRITRPDDWHVHLRDGDALAHTASDLARYFGRAIVMPNLVPPITTTAAAIAYGQRIAAAQQHCARQFTPLPVLYLTDATSPQEIAAAKNSGAVFAAKLYPAGATTNSANGVTDLQHIYPVLGAMQEHDLPLLIHGEVTDSAIDVFDREKIFIERHLQAIVSSFPALRIVFEHITTADAVAFVRATPATVAATITAHHLLYNRNHMLAGNIRPHFYCLPILKRNTHQQALIAAATSGDAKFFLGTDSAPHARHKKETACGCAGCYTAHAAIELYAEAFEQAGALPRLEGFASFFGADFYRLPRNTDTITLRKQAWQVPEQLSFGTESLIPLRAGEEISWQVVAG
ncbi:MAG TPA: dihydroorotase [Spongiibacteraceae bacterium]|nr:dihydroorotase [Spongiibacteraceae bacterium]